MGYIHVQLWGDRVEEGHDELATPCSIAYKIEWAIYRLEKIFGSGKMPSNYKKYMISRDWGM